MDAQTAKSENSDSSGDRGQRIAKAMARAGLCSRREAERWIEDGRVKVNGVVIDTPATLVSDRDRIIVDDKVVGAPEPTRLWLYHKPPGLVTTHLDPEGRPTVFDELPLELGRVISVGRLDLNSEGLLLLTNDGALSRLLEHPSLGWIRTYRVRAHGKITQAAIDALAAGITYEGITYGPIEAEIEREDKSNLWLSVKLREGKNREVRYALAAVGLTVNRLIRVSYGPFQLGELARREVKSVKRSVLKSQIGEKRAAEVGLRFEDPAPASPKPHKRRR